MGDCRDKHRDTGDWQIGDLFLLVVGALVVVVVIVGTIIALCAMPWQ